MSFGARSEKRLLLNDNRTRQATASMVNADLVIDLRVLRNIYHATSSRIITRGLTNFNGQRVILTRVRTVCLRFLRRLRSIVSRRNYVLLFTPFLSLRNCETRLFVNNALRSRLGPLAFTDRYLASTVRVTRLLVLVESRLRLGSIW